MSRIENILKYLDENGEASGSQIAKALGLSRQAINKYLKDLVLKGKITKIGKTKGTVYILRKSKPRFVKKKCRIDNLQEDVVFEELKLRLRLKQTVSDNAYNIINYAFTEMLNNAIEHSQSKECNITLTLDDYNCSFQVRDYGIGLFQNIASKFNLMDETSAIIELSKGKRTTMMEKHSGEGIFFTSKVGDIIKFRSHNTALIFDNNKKDIFIEEEKFLKGTEVFFQISRQTRRIIEDIYSKYAPDEYDSSFKRTHVSIKLLNEKYVSRSEARRLLIGLDKFTEITLDFKDVKSIGQGFADEIFRIFKRQHPEIKIYSINISPILERMINHVTN